ncbi:MAG: aspartate aminotransferase family protein [Deltaproteobacteria bacterium]|nr:aspartate aminotransferase family protein [Deltaproteobacteria bacterium]
MLEGKADKVKEEILGQYQERTQKAREYDKKARKYLPGGNTRSVAFFPPYPIYTVEGKGCRTRDIDGNEYLDFLNNYTSLIHGHADPDIIRAVKGQLEKGTEFATPTRLQYEHAEILIDRLPEADMVRYCNSGTEATLWAVKLARAATGRDMIVKMEGGYHGTHDLAKVSVTPDMESEGMPTAHLEGPGVPQSILDEVVVAPFNNLDAVEILLKKYQGKIAAIIAEPMLGSLGMITPQAGYLQGLRDLADQYGVLLIFDEVITFRLSLGGIQAMQGVRPDITALGKIIGGGFPVGAFCGTREVMDRFGTNAGGAPSLTHAGTFNGNAITMVAGIAALEKYDQAAVDKVNRLGKRMKEGLSQALINVGLKGRATGIGSLLQIHFGDGEIDNAADAVRAIIHSREMQRFLHLEMINRGIFSAGRGMFVVSTPMTESDIDLAVEAFEGSLKVLKPYAREEAPGLLLN